MRTFLIFVCAAILCSISASGPFLRSLRRSLTPANGTISHFVHKKERSKHPYEKRERIAYLVQGPQASAQVWKARIDAIGESATLLYHSFDKNCEICIFEKGTSFSFGRNLLLSHALTLPHRPKYYVFVDEDIQLDCNLPGALQTSNILDTQQLCWNYFTQELLNPITTNILISPKNWNDIKRPDEEFNYQVCIDDAFIAYRSDMAHLLFPIPTYRENENWWHKSHVAWAVIDSCFPFAHASDNRFRIKNTQHRAYPKAAYDVLVIKDVLETEFKGVINIDSYNFTRTSKNRCLVSPQRVDVLDRDCEAKLKNRFMNYYYN